MRCPLIVLPRIALCTAFTLSLAVGCGDVSTNPELPSFELPLPPSTPENVVRALEVIYNDRVRTAAERLQMIDNLLGPTFIVHLQPGGLDSSGSQELGRDEVLMQHEKLFQMQDSGHIFSLRLDLTFNPGEGGMGVRLDPPEPERPDWREIFVSSINFELVTSPGNGFAVQGGQADFLFQPLHGRWYIAEFFHLPRP